MTPFQRLLADPEHFRAAAEATRCDSSTVWRWREGKSYPKRDQASVLIDLFALYNLDYNGIYSPTVPVGDA